MPDQEIRSAINAERLQQALRLMREVNADVGEPPISLIQEVETLADHLARSALGMPAREEA